MDETKVKGNFQKCLCCLALAYRDDGPCSGAGHAGRIQWSEVRLVYDNVDNGSCPVTHSSGQGKWRDNSFYSNLY